jgi:hypothetical protein
MSTESTTTQEAPTTPTTREGILAVLEETRSELEKARDELRGTVRAIAIDRALQEAGVMNVSAARAKLGDAAGLELGAAVAALRAKEPGLFAPRPRVMPGVSTSTPRTVEEGAHAQVRTAASRAATGDRRALLDYMRLRRAAV